MKFAIDSSKNGVIATYIHSNSKIGVMIQLTTESADAAKCPELIELGKEIAMQALDVAAEAQALVTKAVSTMQS
jgi:translation elongation factor EF-Ts